MSSWRWSGSAPARALSTPKGWLRGFLLLKLATVLLLPDAAGLALLAGCAFSLRALSLLRSPRTSTKPSTVLLARLALTDALVPLHWALRLARWTEELCRGPAEGGEAARRREAAGALCQRLLDAHHLASLLLLGLLGLEATLVSRWPRQTLRFRTSHWAQLGCNLVGILVLLELWSSLQPNLSQDSGHQTRFSTLETSQSSSPPSLPAASTYLRRTLWLVNLWMHYAVLFRRPQKRKSLFH